MTSWWYLPPSSTDRPCVFQSLAHGWVGLVHHVAEGEVHHVKHIEGLRTSFLDTHEILCPPVPKDPRRPLAWSYTGVLDNVPRCDTAEIRAISAIPITKQDKYKITRSRRWWLHGYFGEEKFIEMPLMFANTILSDLLIPVLVTRQDSFRIELETDEPDDILFAMGVHGRWLYDLESK